MPRIVEADLGQSRFFDLFLEMADQVTWTDRRSNVGGKHKPVFFPGGRILKLFLTDLVDFQCLDYKLRYEDPPYCLRSFRLYKNKSVSYDRWSIITKFVQFANKGVVMKAVIKNAEGRVIATTPKKRNRNKIYRLLRKS